MNYEELIAALIPAQKKLKDSISLVQKLNKIILKDTESGDLKDMKKQLDMLAEAITAQKQAQEEYKALADAFDDAAYFESGEFTAQLLEACREKNIDVHGEAPVFEMFPYKVRVDAENRDIYLDRKKVACMRPAYFALTVKAGLEKLNRESFAADKFAAELSIAYDLAIMKGRKQPGADILLNSLYKLLVPMSRSRKEYDQQSYAFDLARLYAADSAEPVVLKDGRKLQFGPSRDIAKSIRILDKNGKEQYLATIKFYAE